MSRWRTIQLPKGYLLRCSGNSFVHAIQWSKSPGIDLISTQVLKDSLPIILPALTDIINCSLTASIFPDAWKKSVLISLQKEGDHEIASNNRPLSLLVYSCLERMRKDCFKSIQ